MESNKENKVTTVAARIRNCSPSAAEADISELIEMWLQVEEYFRFNFLNFDETSNFQISLDTSSIRTVLENIKPENVSLFLNEYFEKKKNASDERVWNEDSPFSAELKISIAGKSFESDHQVVWFSKRFLETLFVALNLTIRAGCNFYHLSLILNSDESEEYVELDLNDVIIENAWHVANRDSWPILKTLAFAKVWKWLERQGALTYVLAHTPPIKAIAVLHRCSAHDEVDAVDIVRIAHVLESLLVLKNESKASGLARRIRGIFEFVDDKDLNWIKVFYDLRSKVVHGEYPVFHPRYFDVSDAVEEEDHQYNEVNDILYKGLALLLALLQDLIESDASTYEFRYSMTVHRA